MFAQGGFAMPCPPGKPRRQPKPSAEELGFVERAEGGHGRMSIKKSHGAEGRNFVD